jgi:hypothetical protein
MPISEAQREIDAFERAQVTHKAPDARRVLNDERKGGWCA